MKRLEKMLETLEKIMEERFQESCRRIEEHYSGQSSRMKQELLEVIDHLSTQAANQQAVGEKGEIKYLVISYLYSSIYTGACQMRLDLYDDQFYGDRTAVTAYLDLSDIYQYFTDDMEYFRDKMTGKFPRVREYEMSGLKYYYINYYHGAVRQYFIEIAGDMIGGFTPEGCNLTNDFRILFGGYMDHAEIIGTIPERNENEVFSD